MECFVVISGFLATLRALQIYDALGGRFTFKDILKLYARKVLRIIPVYYGILFFGWFVIPRITISPVWYGY